MGRARVLAVLPLAAPGLATVAQAVGEALGLRLWQQTEQFGSAPLYVVEGGYIWANDAGACIS